MARRRLRRAIPHRARAGGRLTPRRRRVANLSPPFIDFTSASVAVNPGPATKLQVLLPGEIAAQGKPPYDSGEHGGKTGSPDGDLGTGGFQPFVSASTFNITVNLVDQYFNRAGTENTFVVLTSNDPATNTPASLEQKADRRRTAYPTGQTAFCGAILDHAQHHAGLADHRSDQTPEIHMRSGESTWIPVVLRRAAAACSLARRNQQSEHQGKRRSENPRTAATTQIAGSTFTLSVRAVDANYNVVTTTNSLVSLSLSGNVDPSLNDLFSEPTLPVGRKISRVWARPRFDQRI